MMRQCKGIIKTRAMLHILTNLENVLPCATRWSSLCTMVKLFMRIRPKLEEVASTDRLHLCISTTPRFDRICKKLGQDLTEINISSAIAVEKSSVKTRRSKYIEVRYHHLLDKVRCGKIRVYHIPSAGLPADNLTKRLSIAYFQKQVARMGVRNWHASKMPLAVGRA